MKTEITRFIALAAIVALVVIVGSTAVWATENQSCPSSPNYSPDFGPNANCLATNGNASLPAPAGAAATITAWSSSGGIVTFTANNSFAPGEPVILSGFANSTFFNTLVFPVLPTGLSSTQFQIAYSGATGSSDTGVATPVNALQLTPSQTGQAGSAWDTTPQNVASAFSTTFTFQLIPPEYEGGPGEGFAFLIQNSASGTTALGPDGCALGFAGDPLYGFCGGYLAGIPNSVAVAFKTHYDGSNYPNGNSVSIENNGQSANCIDVSLCTLAENDLVEGTYLADGTIHAVTVAYVPQAAASQTNCIGESGAGPCLDVILDGNDLFPYGVPFDMTSIGLSPSNTAWVGFTGATGTAYEYNDILSWVFSPGGGSQTQTLNPGVPTSYNYGGGFQQGNPNSGYDYTADVDPNGQTVTAVVTAIPIQDQPTCNSIVQANPNFNTAQCFVYQNAGGVGVDLPVMFELTCPPGGECASGNSSFLATLGTDFAFNFAENPPLTQNNFPPPVPPPAGTTGMTGLPAVGVLKGAGPDPVHPCTPYPGNNPPLFQSNQISSFVFNPDTSGGAHAGSGGTGSCWLATYQTPGELPTASITAPGNGQSYLQGSIQNAAYTCAAVNNSGINNGAAGPYLTVTACSGPVASGSPFSTGTPGPNTFTVTVTDSALNTNSSTVTYYVQAPPAITSASGTTFVAGMAGSFLVTTTGYPTPSISEMGGLPSGVSFVDNQNGTATLSGIPAAGTGGVYNITITAQNGAPPNATQNFTLTVDQAPTITSANNATFTVGTAGTFTVTTTGFPTPSIGETGGLPSGVTFLDNGNGTGTLSGTPTAGGVFNINFTAQNGVGSSAMQPFTLTVNQAPAITSANTASFSFGVFNSFTVTTTGFPTPSIGESGALPSGVSFVDNGNGTGTLAGTPTVNGTFPITFTAANAAGQVGQSFTLFVNGLTVNPSTLDFGTVYLNGHGKLDFTVTNVTKIAIKITSITITPGTADAEAYQIVGFCKGTLKPGASCKIGVTFFADAAGTLTATVNMTDSASGHEQVALTANVIDPVAQFNPASLNFGSQAVGSRTTLPLQLTNVGQTDLTISDVTIGGAKSGAFSQTNNCPAALAPAASCTIEVTFAPTAKGSQGGSLIVSDNVPEGKSTAPLKGVGH